LEVGMDFIEEMYVVLLGGESSEEMYLYLWVILMENG